jgi:hypothetical protein
MTVLDGIFMVTMLPSLMQATATQLREVGITDRVLCFVRSLCYASFADRDDAPSTAEAQLEPWQVKHATAILAECPELDGLRFTLCPKCVFLQK